ncbi:redoxin domain-containing protein [Nonlabens sp.]|uniref:redoxin domain-containing protein n=1 Tax=Nonlabens sp. TaxID=1888209 RepID=UPI001BCE934F|nr:redoxin domain-containing protein [Nonlabens sp.]
MFEKISLSRKRNPSIFFTICAMTYLVFLSSCENKHQSNTTSIVLIGKIINPRTDHVILRNYAGIQDTLKLNKKGVFTKRYEGVQPGLFTFVHTNEYQSFYVGYGDTLRWRLNTKAFDESLSFTGAAAKENNYLIDLFLEIEKSNRSLLSEYQREPSNFKQLIDDLIEKRIKKLRKAAKKDDFQDCFVENTIKIIKFNGWSRLERYAYTHYGKNDILKSDVLPSNFYSYQHHLKIDDSKLLNNYAYRTYITSLVSNIALYNCARKHGSGKAVDRMGYDYRKEKLHVIDSLFTDQELKGLFAGIETRNFIRNRKNAEEIKNLVSEFLKISEDDALKDNITKMAATYMNLDPGNKLPDFELYQYNNKITALSAQVKGLGVLFYWSNENESYALRIHKKVNELRGKYPEINFIGINLDDPTSNVWHEASEKFGFNESSEFQLVDSQSISKQLALRNDNRSMVVGPSLTIIDPNINLFHYQIETTLLGYLSR